MKQEVLFSRILSIAKKEVKHIIRDPFTLALALGLPLILVTFFGYAINFDVRNIRLFSIDRDHTRASRELIEVFDSSEFFKVTSGLSRPKLLHALDIEKASVILVIEPNFGKDLGLGKTAEAQVVLDGADNSTAGVILGYLAGIQKAAIKKLTKSSSASLIELKTRFIFNPELNSRWFIIPGLAVVVMAILSVLLTALTVAREWENGSMELLLSTPVKPIEIIMGKLAPYVFLGLASVFLIYLIARVGFGVPFLGSHMLFLVCCLLFLGTTLSQGLLISVVTRQQQIAMQLSIVTGLLPSLLLSGFIFPIENMPIFFQYFTAILPARWFIMICRGIFLRGAGISELFKPFLVLGIMNLLLITISTKRFKRDLEP
jgi:ABC-2 type transport system permease protein